MSEPVSPSQYRKEVLRLMMEQTEGWKLVLERAFALCKESEHKISDPQWGSDVRLDAIGRKTGVLLLIDSLYKEAEISSPFEEHYARLLTALRLAPPPREPQDAPESLAPPAGRDAETRLQRRRAGSVA